jgi:hypothetical protein
LPLLSQGQLDGSEARETRDHVATCAWCQRELRDLDFLRDELRRLDERDTSLNAPSSSTSSSASTAASTSRPLARESIRAHVLRALDGDLTTERATDGATENTFENTVENTSEAPARPTERWLLPRQLGRLAPIAAVLLIALLAGTVFLPPQLTRLLTSAPQAFSTGPFERVPLPVVPGADTTGLVPSPREPATAFVCAAPPQPDPTSAPVSGAISLWITHNAGQTWSRAPLPEVSGVYCGVDPAWDGSHRVVMSISSDVLYQNAPACAHSRVFLSEDDGATWRSISVTSLAPPVSQVLGCFAKVTARHLYLGILVITNGNQRRLILERSDDDGQTWQRADQGLAALTPIRLAQPLDATGEALVTLLPTTSGGITQGDYWVTYDAGAHWQRVPSDPSPDAPFISGYSELPLTEPALADASRACHCVFVVNSYNVFNQRPYATRDLVHLTPLPPLPVKGASAQFSGVYATVGMTGDGRLLALGPAPDDDLSALLRGLQHAKAPPALWMWDTHTGRWSVARTQLPCPSPQDCYRMPFPLIGVSVSAGANGQPPGTWFWLSGQASGDNGPPIGPYYRVFIPAS